MASEDDPLYCDLPSRTLVYIFSLYIHHPWHTWSMQVNIQYANLENKEITQRLTIFCVKSSRRLLPVADPQNFTGVTLGYREERLRRCWWEGKVIITECHQFTHHVTNTVNILITNLSPKRKTRKQDQSET